MMPSAARGELGKLFDKLPPHAIEVEMALLGSMILDGQMTGEVLQVLHGPDDFYDQKHAAIYEILIHLYDHNQSIDMVQLNQHLKDKGLLDQVGGLDYLIQIAESVPSARSTIPSPPDRDRVTSPVGPSTWVRSTAIRDMSPGAKKSGRLTAMTTGSRTTISASRGNLQMLPTPQKKTGL